MTTCSLPHLCQGRTALHIAVLRNGDCVRLLLAHGADVNARDIYQRTPLRLAAECAAPACVRLMIAAATAPLDADVDMYRFTLLHIAAMSGHVAVAQLLLDAGVDSRATAKSGETALLMAQRRNRTEMVQFLSAAEQLTEHERADSRARLFASLESERRVLARDRLDLIRPQAAEICIALQTLELPALLTVMIIEEACRFAHRVTMHQTWSLVVAVKHCTACKGRTKTPSC